MLNTKIIMNEAIVISKFTPEEIKKVEKYKPDTLKLFDENGDIEFKYEYTGCSRISYYGIEFGDTTNDGKAVARVQLCGKNEDEKRKCFKENFGSAVLKASDIEETISEVLSIVDDELALVDEAIEMCL